MAVHKALQEILPEQKLALTDRRVDRTLELVKAALKGHFDVAIEDAVYDGAMRRLWYTIFPDRR